MMHYLANNPWLIEWAAMMVALLLGVAVVVVSAPTIERLITPNVSE